MTADSISWSVKVLGAFITSGFVHAAASMAVNGANLRQAGELFFFSSHGFAVVVSAWKHFKGVVITIDY